MSRVGRSVDLITTTIAAPPFMKHSSDNTYISAVGKKSGSHKIEQRYAQDILDFNKDGGTWIYWPVVGREVLVNFDLTLVLADNPELLESTCVTRGNGTFTSRNGFLLDAHYVSDKLPACSVCFSQLINEPLSWYKEQCGECANYDYCCLHAEELLKVEPPTGYPTDSPHLHNGCLFMRCSDFKDMRTDCKTAFDNVLIGNWSHCTAEVFLGTYGINGKTTAHLLENADNFKMYRQKDKIKESNPSQYQYYVDDYANFPKRYIFPKLCHLWYPPYHIDMFVDEPMHLLPEGAVSIGQNCANKLLN